MTDRRRSSSTTEIPVAIWQRLRDVRGFVFDMDGTMVLGDRRNHGLKPLAGALEITRWLTERGVPFVVFTNGTMRTPKAYAETLRGVGFDLADDMVMTPASSALDVLSRRGQRRVVVLGNEGLVRPLVDAGIEVLPPAGAPRADAVLVGWYREFTMDALESACQAIWGGATLYSCSQSVFFASAEGRALGTSRAIAAMITSLTGCRLQIVGKPSLAALGSAGRRLGVGLRELAVVGDDPALEVPMAHRGHAFAVAVNTGLGTADAFAHLPQTRWPHLVVRGVDELLSLCMAVRNGSGSAQVGDGDIS